jgi:hypothetical protein
MFKILLVFAKFNHKLKFLKKNDKSFERKLHKIAIIT